MVVFKHLEAHICMSAERKNKDKNMKTTGKDGETIGDFVLSFLLSETEFYISFLWICYINIFADDKFKKLLASEQFTCLKSHCVKHI